MDISDYELLSQQGVGRDGVSYQARHPKKGHLVELRLLQPSRLDKRDWGILEKNISLASQLTHFCVLKIEEYTFKSPRPCLALEWLQAQTLEEFVEGNTWSFLEKLQVFCHLLDALREAHHLGLVHGRLSPQEIYVTKTGAIKVDFSTTRVSAYLDQTVMERGKSFCQSPEWEPYGLPNRAADIYSLGAIFFWLVTGKETCLIEKKTRPLSEYIVDFPLSQEVKTSLEKIVSQMLDPDFSERPLASGLNKKIQKIIFQIEGEKSPEASIATTVLEEENKFLSTQEETAMPKQIGRFQILKKLGEGGMGTVYQGKDNCGSIIVAIKILSPHLVKEKSALQRFYKEARLMAKVNNPYIVNLLEINEEKGLHYLVLEFVRGVTVGQLLSQRKQLPERLALTILADVARALLPAHVRGIVHRDIKPDNILLTGPEENLEQMMNEGAQIPLVKLSDFGLARHVMETESLNLTQPGSIIGTPLYMSPEQCSGNKQADARSDIYSMGVTLFTLLTGETPFQGESIFALISMHHNKAVPSIQEINPEVSEAVVRIVEKCMAKDPDERYEDAQEILREMENLLHGKASSELLTERYLASDPKKRLEFNLKWELKSSSKELWPHVSNTERLNHAIGLPPVEYSTEMDPEKGLLRFGKARIDGVVHEWQEHAFEWIEEQRFGVLREYKKGFLKWFTSVVQLEPRPEGGTLLTHNLVMEPRGVFAQMGAVLKVKTQTRRSLEQVYQRIDQVIGKKENNLTWEDPFEDNKKLKTASQKKLEMFLSQLGKEGVSSEVTERLGNYLSKASDQEVARIRPLLLARRLKLNPEEIVTACMKGARIGLFNLLWDILCPICRVPSELRDTLQAINSHGHCQACSLEFDLDFHESIEMIFQVHSSVRESELRVYCIGSPAHLPHVVAQLRILKGDRVEFDLKLEAGDYKIWSPQNDFEVFFQVEGDAPTQRWDLSLKNGLPEEIPRFLDIQKQTFSVFNDLEQEIVVRIEKTTIREEALTAKRAIAMPIFRQLFPHEILSPGKLVSISTVTFLATRLDKVEELYLQKNDDNAFRLIYEYFQALEDKIQSEGGVIVKTVSEGVLATFSDTALAVKTALQLQSMLNDKGETKNLDVCVAVHHGPSIIATVNERLDYFGTTLKVLEQMLQICPGQSLVLSHNVAGDPHLSGTLDPQKMDCDIFQAELLGMPESFLLRVTLPKE